MLLAIGDIVRVRQDRSIGEVTGIAKDRDASLVSVRVAGGVVCVALPSEVEVVARGYKPHSASRSLAAVLCLITGILTAAMTSFAVRDEGGGLLLTTFVAVASTCFVSGFLANLCLRPRRIRI